MDEEKVRKWYLGKDYNCAETVVHLLNEEYHLGLDEKAMKIVGGFGGGMGCGRICGALLGSIAAFSAMKISVRAHTTEGLKEGCAEMVAAFGKKLGSLECSDLRKRYHDAGETRCLKTIVLALEAVKPFFEK